MYKLYAIPGSCSTGIHVLLNSLECPFEIIFRDDIENYTALVPTNQVPALHTPDNLLTEGAAIALHLLAENGREHLAKDQEFMRWLMFNYATLHPAYSKLFNLNAIMADGKEKSALMQLLADRIAELWRIVDRHLQESSFIHGNSASLLDYLLAVYVRWGNMFPGTNIPVGNNVLNLVSRIVELPEFQQALAREDISYTIPENALAA